MGGMFSKSSPTPPPAPDYTGAAQAQGAANVEAARASAKLSNPNVYSPYGNQTVTYGANGDQDQATVTQTLTPAAQRTLDVQQQVQTDLANLGKTGVGTAQNVLSTPFSFGGPAVQTGLDTSGVARMPVNAGTTGQDAIMARLAPQQARDRTSYETQLTNQGLRPGMEAWDNGMRSLNEGQNDARSQAALQGIGLDMSANNQGYNQALQSGQFGNTAQQQMLAQAIQDRQRPLNEITALMSGSQIQNPQFGAYQGQTIAPAPLFQAAQAQGQSDMNMFGLKSNSAAAGNSATAGLAGAAMTAAAMY